MANNRLYICCPKCRDRIMLGKHFGGTYNIRVTIDDIAEFFDAHRWCYAENNNPSDKGVFLAEEDGHYDTMTGVEITEDYFTKKEGE